MAPDEEAGVRSRWTHIGWLQDRYDLFLSYFSHDLEIRITHDPARFDVGVVLLSRDMDALSETAEQLIAVQHSVSEDVVNAGSAQRVWTSNRPLFPGQAFTVKWKLQ
jgi:hypothetical protein